jgi:WhiB family redox-sensing transcriptional regulator
MHAWQEPFQDTGTSALWSWRLRAACRHVESAVFFPPDGERPPQRDARETRAKAICGRCPVIRQCAAYAIQYGERYGVWGGLSEQERAALAPGPGRALAAVRTNSADLSNAGRGIP